MTQQNTEETKRETPQTQTATSIFYLQAETFEIDHHPAGVWHREEDTRRRTLQARLKDKIHFIYPTTGKFNVCKKSS